MPSDEYIPVTPGVLYQGSMYVNSPVGTARLSVTFRNSVGSTIASDVRLQQSLAMNGTWQRMSGLVVAPENAATMEVFIAISVSVGQIQPNMEFGAANLLIEHPNYDVVRTNLQTDPRAVGPGSTSWSYAAGTGGASTSAFITGAVDGPTLYGTTTSPTYKRNTVTTAPSGGTGGPFMNATMPDDYPDPIPAGMRWTAGAFFRSNRTVSGTVRYRVINSAAVVIDEFTEPFTLTAGVWQYLSGSKVAAANLVDPETIQVFAMVGGSGGAAAIQLGDIYETTGGLSQVGTSASEDYFDSLRPASGLTAYLPAPNETLNSTITRQVLADDTGSYFDGFTDGFHWEGPANDSESSSDLGVDYQIVSGWSGDPPTEPTVLDFVARTDSVFLSITPTQIGAPVPTDLLLIESATVRRIPRPGVVAFGSGNEFVPPSDGWTHNAPAGMQVIWVAGEQTQMDAVRTDAQAPFASALTYTTAHGVERTVFGLIPGSRYRLMIEFDEGWRETDTDPLITLDPFVAISNSAGAVATYTQDNDIQHFWVVEFTATATSSVVAFHPNSNLALGSFGSVTWAFDQYMVEEILQTDATEPQPGRFQQRTMYEVKASQGPVLTNVRTSPCGVMGQVTFAVRAGNPFKYRSPIFAGGLPGGTSVTVPDVPCSDDGLAQIINFSYDPSLEVVVPPSPSWAGGGVSTTFNGRVASPTARLGGWVYRLTADSAGNISPGITNYYFTSDVTSGPLPIGSDTLTVSVYVRATTSGTLGIFTMSCFVTMAGFPFFTSPEDSVNVTVVGQWYRLSSTFTIPDNVDLSGIETIIEPPPDVAAAVGMEADALMIQRGDVATDAFDQTVANVEWSGDPNESALLFTPLAEDVSEDPDCPAPPAPPAPPEVDNACVAEPISYTRTVVSVSADTVPRNLTAYPVITLVAGSAPVRQARIRFWENPDNLTIDQLNPCSYDGEIIVSYLADGATMVIDGVLREATVSKPGFEDQNANHVLYGPDGGPVDWPELTGGIPYLVTLELDSAAPYTDTLMSVDLVVRD